MNKSEKLFVVATLLGLLAINVSRVFGAAESAAVIECPADEGVVYALGADERRSNRWADVAAGEPESGAAASAQERWIREESHRHGVATC